MEVAGRACFDYRIVPIFVVVPRTLLGSERVGFWQTKAQAPSPLDIPHLSAPRLCLADRDGMIVQTKDQKVCVGNFGEGREIAHLK